MLPKEELYTPPLNIRVRDNRQFGRKPMVGVHVLKSLEKFRCQPLAIEGEDSSVDMPSKHCFQKQSSLNVCFPLLVITRLAVCKLTMFVTY